MCDPLSLASAGSDIIGGLSAAADARHRANLAADLGLSAAKFEATQMEALRVLSAARLNEDTVELQREFAEVESANLNAAAISGLNPASFASITEGNAADRRRGQRRLATAQGRESRELALRARMTLLGARSEGAMARSEGRSAAMAAIFAGFTSAGSTLYQANTQWEQARPISHNADGSVRYDADGAAIPQTRLESVFGEGTRLGSMFRRE